MSKHLERMFKVAMTAAEKLGYLDPEVIVGHDAAAHESERWSAYLVEQDEVEGDFDVMAHGRGATIEEAAEVMVRTTIRPKPVPSVIEQADPRACAVCLANVVAIGEAKFLGAWPAVGFLGGRSTHTHGPKQGKSS